MNGLRWRSRWGAALAVLTGLTLALPAAAQKPADLIQIYADALANNASFRARLAKVEAVDQLHLQAEGQLLPQVGVLGSYDYVDEEIEGRFFGLVDVDNDDSFDRTLYGVQLTQALYRPELVITRDQATLSKAQARFQLEADEGTLMLEVAEAYFGVLAALDLESFYKAEQEALQTQLDQVGTRTAAGLATQADLAAARAQYAVAGANVVQAAAALQGAYAALDAIAGKVYRSFKVLPEGMVLARPQPATVAPWLQRAREQNLTVLGARLSLQIAELELEKARKTRWPRVDAAASASRLDNGGGLSGDREETETRVGVKLVLPLYAGGSIDAKIAEALANREVAAAELEAAEQAAERDARLAYLQATNGIALVPARRASLDAAREAEAATVGGFDAGTLTTADVLRVIRSRYEAERDYSAARYTFMLDSLRLKQAAGDLTNADLNRFDRLLRPPSAVQR
ncbi:TolC family outer membrane protein [Panacagrimonas sp.]|uniref:TolC family outer membrane protein n=1 Tax=Panacagrimonas sp. TaxID=2480088 RepID=UPI003B52C24D